MVRRAPTNHKVSGHDDQDAAQESEKRRSLGKEQEGQRDCRQGLDIPEDGCMLRHDAPKSAEIQEGRGGLVQDPRDEQQGG